MSAILFGEKKSNYVRKVKRNDVRKPNVSSSVVGDIIEKPKHLAVKKKELLEEKRELLKKKRKKRRTF